MDRHRDVQVPAGNSIQVRILDRLHMEKNNLTRAEKIAFIVKTELEMLKDMRQGIKLEGGDRHAQSRKLIEEYRKELGLIRK